MAWRVSAEQPLALKVSYLPHLGGDGLQEAWDGILGSRTPSGQTRVLERRGDVFVAKYQPTKAAIKQHRRFVAKSLINPVWIGQNVRTQWVEVRQTARTPSARRPGIA